jgi:hypothetical protein
MPAPSAATYSVAAVVGANTFFVGLVDAGASAGSIKIRDAGDVLLAQIPLNDPCGSVDGGTGQLTLSIAARDEPADASGTAAYAEICDSDGVVHLTLPVQQNIVAAPGYLTLDNLTIALDAPVEITSVVIG